MMDDTAWALVAALSAMTLAVLGKPRAQHQDDRKQLDTLREFGFIK